MFNANAITSYDEREEEIWDDCQSCGKRVYGLISCTCSDQKITFIVPEPVQVLMGEKIDFSPIEAFDRAIKANFLTLNECSMSFAGDYKHSETVEVIREDRTDLVHRFKHLRLDIVKDYVESYA